MNTIQEKLLKENFKKGLDENKDKLFEMKFVSDSIFKIQSQENYIGDLTKLVSCSKNYFEDIIKIYSDDVKVIDMTSDLDLKVEGNGLLYIVIKNNCSLNLDFSSAIFSNIFVKILVLEGIKFNFSEKVDNENLSKFVKIISLEKSSVKIAQFVLKGKICETRVRLGKKSYSDLKSVYHTDSDIYIDNISHHVGSFSNSNIDIQGAVFGGGKVINDGKVIIEKNAPKSTGLQNMKNLILDNKSKVIWFSAGRYFKRKGFY